MIMVDNTRCGYVAIVGRPNVGKSTLMNHLLGQKISITSRKPQTTRHRVLGIKTEGSVQAIYVDTPGIHQQESRAINRMMNRAATGSVKDVDVIVMVVDALKWNEGDEHVLHKLQSNRAPVILAINKLDSVEDKNALLP
ncbi:MAG: GTPase Era, partial [Ketobacter sp.]